MRINSLLVGNKCPKCRGKGHKKDFVCTHCTGTGLINREVVSISKFIKLLEQEQKKFKK